MSTTSKVLIWSSIIGAVSGIGFFLYSNIKKAMDFGLKIQSLKLNSYDTSTINITLIAKITNDSNILAHIKSYDFDLFVKDKKVADINSSTPATIKPKSSLLIDIPVSIKTETFKKYSDYMSIISAFTTSIANSQETYIELKGSLSGEFSKINIKEIPIDIKYTLKEIIEK